MASTLNVFNPGTKDESLLNYSVSVYNELIYLAISDLIPCRFIPVCIGFIHTKVFRAYGAGSSMIFATKLPIDFRETSVPLNASPFAVVS